MTMNVNRLVQNVLSEYVDGKDQSSVAAQAQDERSFNEFLSDISSAVEEQAELLHKYLYAFNTIALDMKDAHMITIYDAGFIAPEKQYLTLGVNGLTEAAQFLGLDITDNDRYAAFVNAVMKPIWDANKAAKTKTIMFNTEMVPKQTKSRGHVKPLLIDLEILYGQQGASVMAA